MIFAIELSNLFAARISILFKNYKQPEHKINKLRKKNEKEKSEIGKEMKAAEYTKRSFKCEKSIITSIFYPFYKHTVYVKQEEAGN